MARRSFVGSVLAVVLVAVLVPVRASAGEVPVLLLHGFDGSLSPGTDCRVNWKPVTDELQRQGRTRILTVGYYVGDRNCSVSMGRFGHESGLATMAQSFNVLVNRYGRVDVVAHSMGGIIASYARAAGATKQAGFKPTRMRNLVVVASPLEGTAWADLCWFKSCRDMRPGSVVLQKLGSMHTGLPAGGTDVSLFTSWTDSVAPFQSAIIDGPPHAVIYVAMGHSAFLANSDSGTHPAFTRRAGMWRAMLARPPVVEIAVAATSMAA